MEGDRRDKEKCVVHVHDDRYSLAKEGRREDIASINLGSDHYFPWCPGQLTRDTTALLCPFDQPDHSACKLTEQLLARSEGLIGLRTS